MVDAEWTILYDKLDKIVKSGAKVVLSKLPIGDVATQYFADRSVGLLFQLMHIIITSLSSHWLAIPFSAHHSA